PPSLLLRAAVFVVAVGTLTKGAGANEPQPPEKPAKISAGDLEFFETRIRPVLVQHCYECHAADSKIIRGGLLVDSREGIRTGGDSGPAVVPGNAKESAILGALRHETYDMPPERKLPDTVIEDFENWIARGAADPRNEGKG